MKGDRCSRSRCDIVVGDDSHFHVARTLALVLAKVAHVLHRVNRCSVATPDTTHATPDKRLVLNTRCYKRTLTDHNYRENKMPKFVFKLTNG